MRIRGFYDYFFKPKAPSVYATLLLEDLGISKRIIFLIDTGASATLLLDSDVLRLGLNVNELKKSEEKISGVGGSADTYIIKNANIIFEVEEKRYHTEKTNLYVCKHSLSKYDEDTKEKILMMPSLLGRDIINKFDLFCSAERETVYLEMK